MGLRWRHSVSSDRRQNVMATGKADRVSNAPTSCRFADGSNLSPASNPTSGRPNCKHRPLAPPSLLSYRSMPLMT
eukprot:3535128-Alexandrium_andersonii.AAC.1